MTAVPDPALDGPDAERAIAEALDEAGYGTHPYDIAATIAAMNDRDVVLCDERLLTELVQRATNAEAEVEAHWREIVRLHNDLNAWSTVPAVAELLQRATNAEAEAEALTIQIHGCGCPAPYDTCPHDEPLLSRLNKAEAEVRRLRAEVAFFVADAPDTAAAVAEQTGDPR